MSDEQDRPLLEVHESDHETELAKARRDGRRRGIKDSDERLQHAARVAIETAIEQLVRAEAYVELVSTMGTSASWAAKENLAGAKTYANSALINIEKDSAQ